MSGRIWPGALCYITHPTMFGRMVEALYEAPVGVPITLPDGYRNIPAPCAGLWVVKFLGGPVSVPCVVGSRMTIYAVIPSRWLRPILPPPASDTTEDRAPCELRPGEIVGV